MEIRRGAHRGVRLGCVGFPMVKCGEVHRPRVTRKGSRELIFMVDFNDGWFSILRKLFLFSLLTVRVRNQFKGEDLKSCSKK